MSKLAPVFVALFCSAAAAAPSGPADVVGGTTVPAGKYPAVVAVELDGGWCSGTLIGPDLVLTAGHCIDAGPQAVFVGTLDYEHTGEADRIPVVDAYAYPRWERTYDVGVLVLARDAKAEPRPIAGACTAKHAVVMGADVQLVGYGLTSPSGTDDNSRLHETTLAITDPTCDRDPSCMAAVAPNGEFAAGGRGRDACFGDSGGPVFASTPNGLAVVGVVSRGMSVAGAPCGGGGIYVRADKVAAWIHRVTGKTVARSTCSTGAADEPGESDEASADEDGGCTAGRGTFGTGALIAIVLLAALLTRQRAG